MSALAELTLPNAIQTSTGKWTKSVSIDEMTGREEDILADRARDATGKGTLLRSMSRRMSEILSRCTIAVGDEKRPDGRDRKSLPDYFTPVWEQAFLADRGFAMIRLRQLSLGNDYIFKTACPSCKKELKRVKVELDRLDVTSVPLEIASMPAHEFTLPKSNKRLTWRFLKGTDEEYLSDTIRVDRSKYLSMILARRILQVDGSERAPGVAFVEDLPAMDRRLMGQHFDASEGGIDTEIQVVCDGCERQFSQRLDVAGADFFFPSETTLPQSSNSLTSATTGGSSLPNS